LFTAKEGAGATKKILRKLFIVSFVLFKSPFENLGKGVPSPFPLPKRARARNYGIDYPTLLCVE
jgi:hypothetical protein